ncbi:DinB family protein [Chryseolinea lacunae]|uniref:DinB family protein n=1 Tax=Chryseolinea lacunae TaxID=2801331 RepID=A0ABS1KWZ1_9BACT|nr:DinB family protein [Chryseolinea lacunae]MBL0742806.1 DinB family protein [Chryseolinea lacunae]
MKPTIDELRQLIKDYTAKFSAIPESEFSVKPLPHKWSKKEVVGHLIDSAHNNLRRFICGQYEPFPPHIVYHQDFWVYANAYGHAPQEDVIVLWKLINHQLCTVLETMPAENYGRQCNTSKDGTQLRTLEWLAQDYVKHMKHHLNQIFPGSFEIAYT